MRLLTPYQLRTDGIVRKQQAVIGVIIVKNMLTT